MYDTHTTYIRAARCGDVVAPRPHSFACGTRPGRDDTADQPGLVGSTDCLSPRLLPGYRQTSFQAVHRRGTRRSSPQASWSAERHGPHTSGPDRTHHFAFTRVHLDCNPACSCPPGAGYLPQCPVRRYLRDIAGWRRTMRTLKQDPEKLARAQKTLATLKKSHQGKADPCVPGRVRLQPHSAGKLFLDTNRTPQACAL